MVETQIADRVWTWAAGDGSGTATVVVGTTRACVVDPPTDPVALGDVAALLDSSTPGPSRSPGAAVVTAWTRPPPPADLALARAVLGPAPAHVHDAERDTGPDEPEGLVWFSSVSVVDLGDRSVELLHLGRGPEGGGTVAVVTGADVLAVGDLVAPSGATPALGAGCHPLDWPLTLDLLLGLAGADTVVVPRHGPPVSRALVEEQRHALGVVAETIRDLVERGIVLEAAPTDPTAATTWPYPIADLVHAVRRGYAQLPHSQRRLPLV